MLTYLGYPLDRKQGLGLEVVEVVADRTVLLLSLGTQVVLQDLGEQHLAHPDHAAPAGVSHEATVVAVVPQQLGKSGAVSNP